jgi:hypothetical protein
MILENKNSVKKSNLSRLLTKNIFRNISILILAVFTISSPILDNGRKIACVEDTPLLPPIIPASQLPLTFSLLDQIAQKQFPAVSGANASNPEYMKFYNLLYQAEQDYFEGLNRARIYYGNLGGANSIQMPRPIQLQELTFFRAPTLVQPAQSVTAAPLVQAPAFPVWTR